MFDVEGFILVGGQSRRMGRDKAQLLLRGRTLVARIADELSPVVTSVSLVGARQEVGSFRNVPDVHGQWGALGGIHAALKAAETEWAIVVACDLPFVTSELFERLRSLASDNLDAVVPIQSDGRPQPVCALYRRTCLPEIESLVAAGQHMPRALLGKLRTHHVPFDQLATLAGAANFFFNVNTPQDLEQARLISSSGATR